MKPSRKPRHWVTLFLALAWTVTAGMAVADFSGNPEPRWRRMAIGTGPALTILALLGNRLLDRREAAAKKQQPSPQQTDSPDHR
jgi:cytochrome b561